MDVITAALSIIAIVVSVLSVRYARDTAKAAKEQLALEQHRHHEDFKPRLLAEYAVTDGSHEAIRITNKGPFDLREIAIELGDRNQIVDRLAGSEKIEHVGPWAIGDGDGYVLNRISPRGGIVSLRCICVNVEGQSWTVHVTCEVPENLG